MTSSRSADVDTYIDAATPDAQSRLLEIRRIVHAAIPDATETISYKMPAFRQRRVFFYFAAFKHHIGIYPPLRADSPLVSELKPWANEKGNLRFPLDQPMPWALIERLATALAEQYG